MQVVSNARDPLQEVRRNIMPLWKEGDLFHNFQRYPERQDAPRIDRLCLILEKGLMPPSLDPKKEVCSDLRLQVTGTETSYDSVIFLHQYKSGSNRYVFSRPGVVTVLIDPAVKILTQDDMDKSWPVLCADEVYADKPIPPEKLIGLVVHPTEANAILKQFEADLKRLKLPVYDIRGKVLWPAG